MFNNILAVRIIITLKNRDRPIPKLRAVVCNEMLFSRFVIEASAIALSAESINSKQIMIGRRGAISSHLSIPSSRGVKERNAAVSIGSFQNKVLKPLSNKVSG